MLNIQIHYLISKILYSVYHEPMTMYRQATLGALGMNVQLMSTTLQETYIETIGNSALHWRNAYI